MTLLNRKYASGRPSVRLKSQKRANRIPEGPSLRLPNDSLILTPGSGKQGKPELRNAFLNDLLPAARDIERRHGLPAAAILAQAALESDWGERAIGKYNIFGIKGEGSLGSIRVPTREYVRGRWIRTTERFAHYASYEEALEAYARTIKRGPYQRARAAGGDPVRYVKALQGIYATDPAYASKLIRLMRTEDLLRI